MNYNLANKAELVAARNRINYLQKKRSRVEIKEIRKGRTLSQNSYLHLIIGAFGLHFGYTIEEAKAIYKQINKDVYFYKKKNRTFYRSSADLNTAEMAKTIDRFMEVSRENGCELPLATNEEELLSLQNEIERSQRYL